MVSVRSCWKLPLCLIDTVPAGFKTDPLPPKAEPVSNSGRASVVTYLRRGEKSLCNSSREIGVRICKKNTSADTKVSEEEGEGGAPAAYGEGHGEVGCLLEPMEGKGGADAHLQPMEDPVLEQVDDQKRL